MAHIAVIGSTKVQLTETQQALTGEQLKAQLAGTYPEVANATVRERTITEGEGDEARQIAVIDFLPQPGRKG